MTCVRVNAHHHSVFAAPLPAPSPVPVKTIEYTPAVEAQTHAEEPEVINTEGKKIFRKRKLAPMPAMAPGSYATPFNLR